MLGSMLSQLPDDTDNMMAFLGMLGSLGQKGNGLGCKTMEGARCVKEAAVEFPDICVESFAHFAIPNIEVPANLGGNADGSIDISKEVPFMPCGAVQATPRTLPLQCRDTEDKGIGIFTKGGEEKVHTAIGVGEIVEGKVMVRGTDVTGEQHCCGCDSRPANCNPVLPNCNLCDAAVHCSGHGTTSDEDKRDGCECTCDVNYKGTDCSERSTSTSTTITEESTSTSTTITEEKDSDASDSAWRALTACSFFSVAMAVHV
jgi:hypothetical protein